MLLFAFTWVLTHFMRDRFRSYPAANSTSDGVTWAWAGPNVPNQVYLSYKHLQASAHNNIARASSYLQTAVFSYYANNSTVISSTPVLQVLDPVHVDSEAVPVVYEANSETVLQVIDPVDSGVRVPVSEANNDRPHTVLPTLQQERPTLDQSEKNSTSQIPRPEENPVPLRDFALNTEYISDLTSHTHSNLGLRQRLGLGIFSSIAGFEVGRTLGQSPGMALVDGGSNEQSCWMFPGSQGRLGIRLKERISIDKFTVDHLPRDMLSDFAILQAPRKVTLWGRVDGPDNSSKAQLYWENMADPRSFEPRIYHGAVFIPLATFEYKLSGTSQSNIQTKEIPRALRSLQMDFEVVVLEITSNWGAPLTSLYRVRVHGVPLKAVALHTRPTI